MVVINYYTTHHPSQVNHVWPYALNTAYTLYVLPPYGIHIYQGQTPGVTEGI